MSPDDRWRMLHMIEAAEQALSFTNGRHRSDLADDHMLRLALTRAVEIIGEAASQVSDEGKEDLTEIPWPQIVGMRNRLVHAYFDIDQNILWDTVQLALPGLLIQLQAAVGFEQRKR